MSKKSRTAKRLKARAAKRDAATNRREDAVLAPLDPPYGYRVEGEERVADEGEGDIIARIRELADKRLTAKEIAAKLTIEEKTCRGDAWDARRVTQILRRKVTKVKGR